MTGTLHFNINMFYLLIFTKAMGLGLVDSSSSVFICTNPVSTDDCRRSAKFKSQEKEPQVSVDCGHQTNEIKA